MRCNTMSHSCDVGRNLVEPTLPKENCGPSLEGDLGLRLLSKKHVYCQRQVKHGGPVPWAGPFRWYLAKR